MNSDTTMRRRKERRYKVADGQCLKTETFVDYADPVGGTVIDISTSGLRMLSEGTFRVGQAILTELRTDRLHGVFPGLIRRVQPWVDGKSVLGCQLLEPIPNDVLAELAHLGVVNRRDHARVEWIQPAKMSWELTAGEVDIEIHDCSSGGLKVSCQTDIPENLRLRIRVAMTNCEELIINARLRWQREHEGRYYAGLAFTGRNLPAGLMAILSQNDPIELEEPIPIRRASLRPIILVAGVILVIGAVMLKTGLWG